MAHLMKFDSTLDLTQLSKLSHATRERLLEALALRQQRIHLESLEAAHAPPAVQPVEVPNANQ
jgi:hypothetical protein